MAIALAAIKLGVEVYRPVAEGGRYDLILDVGESCCRVQCKWASRYEVSSWFAATRIGVREKGLEADGVTRADEIDVFAAYCLELDRCFFIPIEDAPTNEPRSVFDRPGAEQPETED